MPRTNDLCQWIEILTTDNATVRSLFPIPKRVLDGLSDPVRFQKSVWDTSQKTCCDVLLALDISTPNCRAALTDLSVQIFQHLRDDGVAIVSVANGSEGQQARLHRLFSYTKGISIRAHVVLNDLNWHCWLIHRNADNLDAPHLIEGWDDVPGDIVVRAVNQSPAELDYMRRLEDTNQIQVGSLDNALSVAHSQFNFNCSGWSCVKIQSSDAGNQIVGSQHQMCLIGGTVSLKGAQPTMTRRIGGVGWSWTDAAFFAACEAIERAADAVSPFPNLAGIAFGFSKEAATYRAILEFFERYYFTRSFVTNDFPTVLDIRANSFLSKVCDALEQDYGEKQFYILSQQEPFYVVLALSKHTTEGHFPRYHYGLGCSANLLKATRKALEETVQIHIHLHNNDETSLNQAKRLASMSVQGRQCHQFWERLDKEAYFDLFQKRPYEVVRLDDSPNSDTHILTEGESLKQLQAWCARHNMSVQTKTLFRSATDCEGWVIRAVCSGFPDVTAAQVRDMTNPTKVPFPLASHPS